MDKRLLLVLSVKNQITSPTIKLTPPQTIIIHECNRNIFRSFELMIPGTATSAVTKMRAAFAIATVRRQKCIKKSSRDIPFREQLLSSKFVAISNGPDTSLPLKTTATASNKMPVPMNNASRERNISSVLSGISNCLPEG